MKSLVKPRIFLLHMTRFSRGLELVKRTVALLQLIVGLHLSSKAAEVAATGLALIALILMADRFSIR